MLFELPTPDKLTEEQKNLIWLNLDSPERKWRWENLVVQWFAGTWKTVVAYYRALRAERQWKNVLVLCFWKVLKELLWSEKNSVLKNIKHADWLYKEIKKNIKDSGDLKGKALLKSETVYWFKKLPNINIQNKAFLKQLFKEYKRIKWYNENQSIYSEIIIDEWQDLSKDVLEALKTLTDHVSIFADDNQWIFDEDTNTTVNEMKEIFCPNWKVEYLTANFRTTKQICLFAAEKFLPENEKVRAITESKTCVDDPESEPQLFWASTYSKIWFEEFLWKFVKKQWAKYESILIVAPRTENVNGISIDLSKKEIPHSVYHSKLDNNLNKLSPFADYNLTSNDRSWILVTTYHSSKWLEADCVFIYMTETEYKKAQWDKKNIFYVLSTRAKRKLFIITDF